MLKATLPQQEQSSPLAGFAAILAAVALVCVLLLIGSVGNLGNPQAIASESAPAASDPLASPEEHAAFIRRGHERAAREGDASPLPATF